MDSSESSDDTSLYLECSSESGTIPPTRLGKEIDVQGGWKDQKHIEKVYEVIKPMIQQQNRMRGRGREGKLRSSLSLEQDHKQERERQLQRMTSKPSNTLFLLLRFDTKEPRDGAFYWCFYYHESEETGGYMYRGPKDLLHVDPTTERDSDVHQGKYEVDRYPTRVSAFRSGETQWAMKLGRIPEDARETLDKILVTSNHIVEPVDGSRSLAYAKKKIKRLKTRGLLQTKGLDQAKDTNQAEARIRNETSDMIRECGRLQRFLTSRHPDLHETGSDNDFPSIDELSTSGESCGSGEPSESGEKPSGTGEPSGTGLSWDFKNKKEHIKWYE